MSLAIELTLTVGAIDNKFILRSIIAFQISHAKMILFPHQ
jgi:hypothetical protein